MKTNIFIPEKIKVGFQNREDTYTKKLAYVIYYDHKGILRKEASWNSWRHKAIQDLDFVNTPTSGLVLNKKVGGYASGWNHRQTYVRVYDPRDFEFEISVPNLLYILENTNSIKGKGLEGEFVYGWDGSDLLLIPTSSPDYIEISQFNKILHEKSYVKSKDLVIGANYRAKNNEEWIYMGRFELHGTKYERQDNGKSLSINVNKGKHYFFTKEAQYSWNEQYLKLLTLKSLGDKFIGVVSSDCAENYANLFDKLERQTEYSPYDESKDEFVLYQYESFISKIEKSNWGTSVYIGKYDDDLATIRKKHNDENMYLVIVKERVQDIHWSRNNNYYHKDKTVYEGTLEQIYAAYKPMYKNKYLLNGKLYQKGE